MIRIGVSKHGLNFIHGIIDGILQENIEASTGTHGALFCDPFELTEAETGRILPYLAL